MSKRPPGDPEKRFSGQPETRWLTSATLDDRQMEMLKDFWYEDWQGTVWHIDDKPIDGASIPRALWTAIGSPYTGDYRRASIVHDTACRSAKNAAERKTADKMFYQACRDGGCDKTQATILYIGVRIGAILDGPKLVRSAPLDPRDGESADDRDRQDLLRQVARDPDVAKAGDSDDIDAIDRKVRIAGKRALAIVGIKAADRRAPTWV